MKTEDDHCKDVYAHFGLAAYFAQCLEAEIKNVFMLSIKANNKELPLDFFDGAEITLNKQMLGVLIRDLKTVVTFGTSAEEVLDDALTKRNQMAHGFFERHGESFISEKGRDDMITELVEYQRAFRSADLLCQAVTKSLCKILGITEGFINSQMDKMYKTAEERDAQHGPPRDSVPAARPPSP